MENLNLYSKSNLDMLENIEFEEKVDIDDLVLPSEPMKLAEIEIKQEPVEEKEQIAAFESDRFVSFRLLKSCTLVTAININ